MYWGAYWASLEVCLALVAGTDLDIGSFPEELWSTLKASGQWVSECNLDLEQTLARVPLDPQSEPCSTLNQSHGFAIEVDGCSRPELVCSQMGQSVKWTNSRVTDRYAAELDLQVLDLFVTFCGVGQLHLFAADNEHDQMWIRKTENDQCSHGSPQFSLALGSCPGTHTFHIGVIQSRSGAWYHYRYDGDMIYHSRVEGQTSQRKLNVEHSGVRLSAHRFPHTTRIPEVLDHLFSIGALLKAGSPWGCSLLEPIECRAPQVQWSQGTTAVELGISRSSILFILLDFGPGLTISLESADGIFRQFEGTVAEGILQFAGKNQACSSAFKIQPSEYGSGLVGITDHSVFVFFPKVFQESMVFECSVHGLILSNLSTIRIQGRGQVDPLTIIAEIIPPEIPMSHSAWKPSVGTVGIFLTLLIFFTLAIILAWKTRQSLHQSLDSGIALDSDIRRPFSPQGKPEPRHPSAKSLEIIYYEDDCDGNTGLSLSRPLQCSPEHRKNYAYYTK